MGEADTVMADTVTDMGMDMGTSFLMEASGLVQDGDGDGALGGVILTTIHTIIPTTRIQLLSCRNNLSHIHNNPLNQRNSITGIFALMLKTTIPM